MKKTLLALALAMSSSLSMNAISDAIYRWVDENGKVHFGESIPPRYKETAEQVESKPINTLAPEPEVKKQNDQAVRKLKAEDANRKLKQTYSKPTNAQSPQQENQLTREYCRDNFVTVKEKTECFKRIQNTSSSNNSDY